MTPEERAGSSYAFPDNSFAAYFDDHAGPSVRRLNPHYHAGYELLYFIEGESHISIDGRKYRAHAGDLAIYRPRMIHEEELQPGPYRIICLRFPKEKVDLPFPGERELQPVIHLPYRERFRHILEQVILEKQGNDPWAEKMAGTYLVQFTVLLWRALSRYQQDISREEGGHRDRISHVIDLIHTRINGDVRLKDLAARAFMSESHFSHTFKKIAGISPKRFMIDVKIGKAQELLSSTDRSIVDISDFLGFQTPQYFNRLFRKKRGCTPLQYRKKSRKVQSD